MQIGMGPKQINKDSTWNNHTGEIRTLHPFQRNWTILKSHRIQIKTQG